VSNLRTSPELPDPWPFDQAPSCAAFTTTQVLRLAHLSSNLSILRRGDLSAGRLALEQQRLAMVQAKSDEEKELEFWQWTKRPDVQAKLYPHRDPDKLRRDVDRMLSHRLLGIPDPGNEPDETADPATLI
jgi:hypothetical protein